MAQKYSVTPYAAARELDRDPERLAIKLLPLYRYADAWNRYENTKDKTKLDSYPDHEMMDTVTMNTYNLRHEQLEHPQPEPDCPDCIAAGRI